MVEQFKIEEYTPPENVAPPVVSEVSVRDVVAARALQPNTAASVLPEVSLIRSEQTTPASVPSDRKPGASVHGDSVGLMPALSRDVTAKPITTEMLKARFSEFESYMKDNAPPEGTAEVVRDIGKGLISGNVKDVQAALGKLDQKQLEAVAKYLGSALDLDVKAVANKGLQFEVGSSDARGRGATSDRIARPDVLGHQVTIYPDKVDGFSRMRNPGNQEVRLDKMTSEEAGLFMRDVIMNPQQYRNDNDRRVPLDQLRPSRDDRPSSSPQEAVAPGRSKPPGSEAPSGPSNGPQQPSEGQKRPQDLPTQPSSEQPTQPLEQPRSGERQREQLNPMLTANAEEFKVRWAESAKALEKTPVGPLVNELGKQLASGKIDAEALQKLMKNIAFNAEDHDQVARLLKAFNQDMNELYGIQVDVAMRAKAGVMRIESVTVKDLGANSTAITLGKEGAAVGSRGGFAGVSALDLSKALGHFTNQIQAGRQDKPKP